MEIEQTAKVRVKKLWKMVTKILSDLRFSERRNLAGKAINSLVELHQSSAFSCVSTDIDNSFISPREYEFSCSNSPAHPFHFPRRSHYRRCHYYPKPYRHHNDAATVAAFQRVLDMLSNNEKDETDSPLVALPGFGKSPLVRQLRITDSPFSMRDEGDSTIDMDAEEFIKYFRADLKQQKKMAAGESPGYRVMSR